MRNKRYNHGYHSHHQWHHQRHHHRYHHLQQSQQPQPQQHQFPKITERNYGPSCPYWTTIVTITTTAALLMDHRLYDSSTKWEECNIRTLIRMPMQWFYQPWHVVDTFIVMTMMMMAMRMTVIMVINHHWKAMPLLTRVSLQCVLPRVDTKAQNTPSLRMNTSPMMT